MKFCNRFLACISALLFLVMFTPVVAGGKTDFEIWNKNRIQGQLNKRVELFGEMEFRYDHSATELYYNHEHIELPIHATSYLIIGPAYRQIFHRNTDQNNQWTTTYMPNLNMTFKWHLGPFNWYDRSRISYLITPEFPPDVWQYRNKLGVDRVLSQKLHEVRIFADEEIFLKQDENGIYENRATVGFNVGLFRKIRMDLAYRNRIERNTSEWNHDNILFIGLYAIF